MNCSSTAQQGKVKMPIRQLGKRRNLIIPPEICRQVGLQEGDFVEVQVVRGTVVIKPKKLVDADDALISEEEFMREGVR
jgi:antitoxin component of MazEF toxin-antitoxin module